MRAEIIAVGTEILLGQIVNTNATTIAKKLQELSIPTYYQSVVGDNEERLLEQLSLSSKRSDLIIICGGIGPTKDDLTKQTLAKFLNQKLIYHPLTKAKIENHFVATKTIMTENNLNQSLIFENAHPFLNHNGLAVGFLFEINHCTYIVLPGPPSELALMLEKEVTPYLHKKINKVFKSTTLRFTNIGESRLASIIDDLIEAQTNPTIAIYATLGDVTVRVTANGETDEECFSKMKQTITCIMERLSEYFYGIDEETLPECVVRLLRKHSKTISVAESLTGGLCQSKFVDVSGASDVFLGGVVTYQNDNKISVLHVDEQIIQNSGAVSRECALDMAKKVQKLFSSHIGLSFTGIADQGIVEGKPSGTVFIGLVTEHSEIVFELALNRNRNENRLLATIYGINEVRKYLESI